VNSVSAKDKDARFDIIGHSLGGLVAAYWVANLPSDDVSLTRIHSVITLESPLGDAPQPLEKITQGHFRYRSYSRPR